MLMSKGMGHRARGGVTGRGRELETLVEEPGGKKSKKKIERVRRTWEDNIKVDLIKIGWFEVKRIHLE